MKRLCFSLLTFALASISSKAQSSDSLIVLRSSASTNFYTGHLLSNPKNYVVKDTLSFYSHNVFCHTYDGVREEFIVVMNSCIVRIDARTGSLVDSMATGLMYFTIEAHSGTNNVLALNPTDTSGLEIYRFDVLAKSKTKLNSIKAIKQLNGRITMDPIQSIVYAPTTNLGIACIDANTGELLDSISNTRDINVMEFHTGNGLIYALYWNNNSEAVLCSLDPVTKVWTDIAVLGNLNGFQLITSIDVLTSRFIVQTGIGTAYFRLQDGTLSDTTYNDYSIIAMEYINKVPVLNPASVQKPMDIPAISAYPNPARGILKVSGVEPGNPYSIWNSKGQLLREGRLTQEGIALDGLAPGIYQLRFSNGNQLRFIKQP